MKIRKSGDVEGEVLGFSSLIITEILENRSQTAGFQDRGLNLSLFASHFIGLLLTRIRLA